MMLRVGEAGRPVIVVVGEVYCLFVSGDRTRSDLLGAQGPTLDYLQSREDAHS